MTRMLNIGQTVKTITIYALAALIAWYMISRGVHPAWIVVLFIFRKAVLRICIFLALLFWLTQSII